MPEFYRIEIIRKPGIPDPEGRSILSSLEQMRIPVRMVRTFPQYFIEGGPDEKVLRFIAEKLLIDPVIETCRIMALQPESRKEPEYSDNESADWSILKTYQHGVTDNAGSTAFMALRRMNIGNVTAVRTGIRCVLNGPLTFAEAKTAAFRVIANTLIESCLIEKTGAEE